MFRSPTPGIAQHLATAHPVWFVPSLVGAILVIVSILACGPAERAPLGVGVGSPKLDVAVPAGLSGTVRLDGSSSVFPISRAVGDWFEQRADNVRVEVGQSGSSNGFRQLMAGACDIANASRPISADELAELNAQGRAILELPVAYDGIAVVVPRSNRFLKQLSLDELRGLFEANPRIRQWRDLNPQWSSETIELWIPGADSGTFDYFKEVVVGPEGTVRADVRTSEDDNRLAEAIARRPWSLGFFGSAYVEANAERLRAVPVVNPQTGQAVGPIRSAIKSGDYAPFSRPLFLYVDAQSIQRPEVAAFVRFYLEAAPEAIDRLGFVALPAEVRRRTFRVLDQRLVGTSLGGMAAGSPIGPLEDHYRPGLRDRPELRDDEAQTD